MQITAYVVEEGRFKPLSVDAPEQLPERAVWVRAIDPTVKHRTPCGPGFRLLFYHWLSILMSSCCGRSTGVAGG